MYRIEFDMPSSRLPVAGAPIDWKSVEIEDGGESLIFHPDETSEKAVEVGGDGHFFVRLHSWHDGSSHRDDPERFMNEDHPLFRKFEGKRVRVTVEVID